MFNTDLYFDHQIEDMTLAETFAKVMSLSTNHVAILDRNQDDTLVQLWGEGKIELVLRKSIIPGDFPIAVELISRSDAIAVNLVEKLAQVAHIMHVSILTDETEEDADWLLVSPDGTVNPVDSQDDSFYGEDPAILLTPESRRIFRFHQLHPDPSTAVAD